MLSIDTETTGLDLRHSARPYFVTICKDDGEQIWCEWDVDPLTREVDVPSGDLDGIEGLIGSDGGQEEVHELVLQNAKFDFAALQSVWTASEWEFGWDRVHDTLIAGHLLASNRPHDLTSMALQYLGIDIQPYDDALKAACNEARRMARKEFPTWQIAKQGLAGMPSAKESCWKYDGWLPRAIAKEREYAPDHPWWTVLSNYANTDSSTTLLLWKAMRAEIERRGLWEIYEERRKVIRVAYIMERDGVTLSKTRLEELKGRYAEEIEKAESTCLDIAAKHGVELKLPKGGNSKQLSTFLFQTLKLPVLKQSEKTGAPSLDKSVIECYSHLLQDGTDGGDFIRALRGKRKRDTALAYMEGYERFWMGTVGYRDWYRLHPSLNPTGTDTLRWSSSNPNEQNISKQEGFNLRFVFGPAPGREWWSLDAKNIELRLPAYEAGETEMIALFERPDDPPFFGSNHLLVFSILFPDLWAKHGAAVKKLYASTNYQWVKNGNFAVQYGAVEESGTAARAYHVDGGQRKVQARFGRIKQLNDRCIAFANKYGYVETMPDKTVNPTKGYPLLCTRSEWGKILPTVPLNYRVQGTAMWWMAKAMVRCQEQLDTWREDSQFDGRIALQVHDELVFDFPKRYSVDPDGKPIYGNLGKIRKIKRLMEEGGRDIGVPTPVSCEYHENNWSEGVSV